MILGNKKQNILDGMEGEKEKDGFGESQNSEETTF